MKIILFFLMLCTTWIYSGAQNAVIQGRIFDALNNEPLPFVNVVIFGTTTGSVTDAEGRFTITGLESGFMRIEASFVGYKRTISPEIEVTSARPGYIEIGLEAQREQIGEITVSASPFRKTIESPVSMRNIGIGEIEKSPGANRDISKVIQSFPGVQSTPAYRNDIIIRGGGPAESRFYLDGIEVPVINHFATQGASGGPVGIINADFIREVNFYSGAFPASRGNALSGVLEFYQADGNTDQLRFQGTLGASEVAATLNGPLNDNSTFIFSIRRSYLQLLFSLLELPFLPSFTDFQFKVKTRIDKKNELTFIGLGAYDISELNLDIEDPDEQQLFILGQIPVYEQWNYTFGASYKHFRDNSFQTIVLSRSHLNNGAHKYIDNDDSNADNKILDYLSEEIETKLRVENTTRINGYKINFGAGIDLVTYTNRTTQLRFYDEGLFTIDYDTNLNLLKWGIFGQVSKSLLDERLTLSLGLRTDGNDYSDQMKNIAKQVSPRFSASYYLSRSWSLNFNTGRYYQLPSYTSLGYKQAGQLINRDNNLTFIQADHLIGGLEYRPLATVLLSLEGFKKEYSNYPFSVKDQISLANKGADFGVIGDEELVSESEGQAYGAELQGRVNTKTFNLNLSYTLVRSEFQNASNEYIPSGWDSKHLLVLTSTAELKNNWRIGGRWRFVGGLPYTPYDLERSSLVEAWNATGSPYFDFTRLNSLRFKPFHNLDIRVDKAFYLNKVTAKFYIDIQNIYNFQAEQQDIIVRETDSSGKFILTDEGSRYLLRAVKNTTGTMLPTIGIIVEF